MGFYLVMPAAGTGSRIGGETKQFRLLGDRPLFIQTLQSFLHRADLDGIVIATREDSVESTRSLLDAEKLEVSHTVIVGGHTRQESVFRALSLVRSEIVLIHDAVRPFAGQRLIDRVLEATIQSGAACPAVPVADTLRHVTDGHYGETVDRDGLFLSQTPQGFRTSQIMHAHQKGIDHSRLATDDVGLYSEFIGPVSFVEGSTRNFKITRKEDWETAEQLWPLVSKAGILR